MDSIKALILTGYGLNCDNETAHSIELAGAIADKVHINSLIQGTVKLENYRILIFGGGFSWGDNHGAGVIQAVRLKNNIGTEIIEFVEAGNLVLGICNGFQTLVNLGLLPGLDNDYKTRSVALTYNDCGNFRDDWVHLKVNMNSPCVFTKGLEQVELPVRHGEGKFYSGDHIIERLMANNQVALQYARQNGNPADCEFPYNPNGSVHDIAGICDPTGRIFGLMPHPEAYNHITSHPDWTLHREIAKRKGIQFTKAMTHGTIIFKNAVDYFTSS